MRSGQTEVRVGSNSCVTVSATAGRLTVWILKWIYIKRQYENTVGSVPLQHSEQHFFKASSLQPLVLLIIRGLPRQAEVAQAVPGRLRAPNFLDVSALQGWYVVSQTHRPPLPQGKSLVLTFRGWVDARAHGSVGGTTEKTTVTPPGYDPRTFWL